MLKLPCMSADGARAITRPKIIRQERNVHLIHFISELWNDGHGQHYTCIVAAMFVNGSG